MTELWRLSAVELQAAYREGHTDPRTVVAALTDRIARLNEQLGAFVVVLHDEAHAEAAARSDELARGETRGPLHGVPVAVKELFDVAGAPATYGSVVLEGRVARRDAVAVRRLREAGAVVMGLTRSHEFGWGITTQHATLGRAVNPWDRRRVPGGSSGGSAVAVATGLVPLALSSDTGGSVRIPAGYCGVVGLKPSYGRVPRAGGVALSPSLDHPGVIARTVADAGLGLGVLAGYDPEDPSTAGRPAIPDGELSRPSSGLRLAVSEDLHLTPLQPDHARVFEDVVVAAERAGAAIVHAAVPEAEDIRPAFAAIQMAEAYHVHHRDLGTFPQRADDYGADVRGRLEMAAEVPLPAYLDAHERRQRHARSLARVFEVADALLTPITAGSPSTVVRPDEVDHLGRTLAFRDLVMDYTVPQNLSGLPACAVPAGFDDAGVPVGVQVTVPWYAEHTALAVAQWLRDALDFQHSWPDEETQMRRAHAAH